MNIHNIFILKQVDSRAKHSKWHVESDRNGSIYAFIDPMHHRFTVPTTSKQNAQSQYLDFIQGKKYLHCVALADFRYRPSFS